MEEELIEVIADDEIVANETMEEEAIDERDDLHE